MTRRLALATLAGLAMPWTSFAQTRWISQQDGKWTDPAHWDSQMAPNGIDASVELGSAGFSDQGAIRTITWEGDVRVGSLVFENTGIARNAEGKPDSRRYVLAGPGRLVFESEGECFLQGDSAGNGQGHLISADMEIASPLRAVGSVSQGRSLTLAGNISGRGGQPVSVILAGKASMASLILAGDNDFHGGTIEVIENNSLDIASPHSANGAWIRVSALTPEDKPGVVLSAETIKHVRFDFEGIDFQSDGYLQIQRRASLYKDLTQPGRTFVWGSESSNGSVRCGSIIVRNGRTLQLRHRWDNQDVVIDSGSEFLLEPDAVVEMSANQYRRHMDLHIRGRLAGSGTFVTESPSLDPGARGNTALWIDAKGAVAPGDRDKPGVLRFGRTPGQTDNTLVRFEPQSRLCLRLDGPEPGSGYDQIILNGAMSLDEAELEITCTHAYGKDDRVFPVVVESGSLTGEFLHLPEGSKITFSTSDGRKAGARIGYHGNSKTSSLTGGSDLVIYDFR